MSSEQITGVVRAILAAIGGYVIAKGWVDAANFETIAGAVVTSVVAGWSIFAKRPASIAVQAQNIKGVDVVTAPSASPAVKEAVAEAKAA